MQLPPSGSAFPWVDMAWLASQRLSGSSCIFKLACQKGRASVFRVYFTGMGGFTFSLASRTQRAIKEAAAAGRNESRVRSNRGKSRFSLLTGMRT